MKKIIYLILPLLILATAFVSADMDDCPMNGGTGYGVYNPYGLGMGVFGWITSLTVLGLVAAGMYWLIKSANKK